MSRKSQSTNHSSAHAQNQSPAWNIDNAQAGILCNPMLSQPPMFALPQANATNMGGLILGSGHHSASNNLDLGFNPIAVSQQNAQVDVPPALNSSVGQHHKSPKYKGVTYRPSREKYQSRIYKDNREYNLGESTLAIHTCVLFLLALI